MIISKKIALENTLKRLEKLSDSKSFRRFNFQCTITSFSRIFHMRLV